MPLDPIVRRALDLREQLGIKDISTLTVEQAREQSNALAPKGDPAPVHDVVDRTIPGPAGALPIRIYRPERPDGIVVFFHGSGFVLCNLDTHDAICRELTNASNCTFVSVDYRLAPEHRYPAAAEDCYAATLWASQHTDELCRAGARIAVAGDSAGGNVAAVVALMARDRFAPEIALAVMLYPVTDYSFERPSYQQNGGGEYGLTKASMEWFWRHYLGSDTARGQEPYASPVRASNLAGVAPAFIATAEYDVLRDEGEAYAAALWEAGVPVTCVRYVGVNHGFLGMFGTLPAARALVAQIAGAIQDAVRP